MYLGQNNPCHSYSMITGKGTPHMLLVTDEEKDLGVIMDHRLRFSKHVQAQVNKANRVLGAIKHTFSVINKTVFLCLYKTLIRLHLEYVSVVWCPRLKRDKDTTERVQHWATRMVEGPSHLSYSERL